MKSTLLRVDVTPTGHRIRLFAENGHADWTTTELAAADLPPIPDAARREEIRRTVLTANGASAEFRTIGQELYALLLDNSVGAALAERLAESTPTRVLLDAGTDDLWLLPWELMLDAQGRSLAAHGRHTFARVSPTTVFERRALACNWPLRVLLVQGTDDVAVRADDEAKQVRDGLRHVCGLIDLEVLTRPSLQQLKDAYVEHRPHVLHFVGHGGLDANGSFLQLDPEDAEGPVRWSPPLITMMLDGWKPALVVLNACQSGDTATQEGAMSVAAAFAALGAGAVIAMQGRVDGGRAAIFAGKCFEELAKGAGIDQAVNAGRLSVLMAAPDDQREYGLATLLLSRRPEDVLDLTTGEPETFLGQQPFHEVRRFVNRTHDRRALWRCDDKHAIGVVSDYVAGKTALLRWYLGLRGLHGDNVVYVNFADGRALDTPAVLDTIAEALATTPTPHRDANAEIVAQYRADVEPLLRQPDDYSRVFERFHQALKAAATPGRLIIGLDQLEGVEQWSWKLHTAERLVEPIAAGAIDGVRLVTTFKGEQGENLLPARTLQRFELHTLEQLESETFVPLALEFLRADGFSEATVIDFVKAFGETLPAYWTAERFTTLKAIADGSSWRRDGR